MDASDWVRALAALLATLGLIGLAAFAARRFGVIEAKPLTGKLLAGKPRRLQVVERLMLDPRRTVVLLRVDDAEHLLLLSPFGEVALGKLGAPAPSAPVAAEPSP